MGIGFALLVVIGKAMRFYIAESLVRDWFANQERLAKKNDDDQKIDGEVRDS